MFKNDDLFFALIIGLTISVCVGINPVCSACSLGLILTYILSNRYLKERFHNPDAAQIKADISKLKTKQDQIDLKNAFSGARNV